MKVAITVPDKLFKSGDALAKKRGISRSKLYCDALAEYIKRQNGEDITDRLNAVYKDVDSSVDPFFRELQARSLPPDKWEW